MTPRNIEYLFRIFAQFIAINDDQKYRKIPWLRATIFLIAIFITDKDIYHKIGQGNFDPALLHSYIKKLNFIFLDEYQLRYIAVDAMAFALTNNDAESEEIVRIISEYDRVIEDDKPQSKSDVLRSLARIVDDNGLRNKRNGFQAIYTLLESWRNFIE